MSDYVDRIARKKQADRAGGPTSIAPEKSDEELAKTKDTEKLTSGLSSGKAAKGGGADMPKQEPGEDAATYGERLRKWRASKPSAATQGKALGGY